MHCLRMLLFALMPAVVPGQTFIVDAANGPGTNYLDLPAAVAAVPDGAVLLVRPGSYQGFTMSAKGISVLGEPGTIVNGSIAIDSTGPQQSVVLRQLTWTSTPPLTYLVDLDQCAGPVLLDGLVQPLAWPTLIPYEMGWGVVADACGQLVLRDCEIKCRVDLVGSCTVVESCWIEGEGHSHTIDDGRIALVLEGGSLQIAGASTIVGGDGLGRFYDPGDGILVNSGDLRVLSGSVSSGYVSHPPFFHGYSIWLTSGPMPRVSPRVALFSANTSGSYPTVVNDDVMPQLTGFGAAPGGSLSATVETELGDLAILAVGLPGPPVTVPGIVDPFWLDPTAHAFVAIGTHTAASPITASVPVPSNPGFLGVCLNWQAACYGPVTGFQATNPVVTLVH